MCELANQSGDVGNNRVLQQGEAPHDGCKDTKKSDQNQNL